jgi:hypothetical protein
VAPQKYQKQSEVIKANAKLESKKWPDLWEQIESDKPDSMLPSPNKQESVHDNLTAPPSPDQRSQALSADQPGRSFSPALHRRETTAS